MCIAPPQASANWELVTRDQMKRWLAALRECGALSSLRPSYLVALLAAARRLAASKSPDARAAFKQLPQGVLYTALLKATKPSRVGRLRLAELSLLYRCCLDLELILPEVQHVAAARAAAAKLADPELPTPEFEVAATQLLGAWAAMEARWARSLGAGEGQQLTQQRRAPPQKRPQTQRQQQQQARGARRAGRQGAGSSWAPQPAAATTVGKGKPCVLPRC